MMGRSTRRRDLLYKVGKTTCERHPLVPLKYRKWGRPTKSKSFDAVHDPVFLITQYFINTHQDEELQQRRQRELVTCLRKNCANKHINKIFLLNEKVYTKEELGLENVDNYDKIHQINIRRRLLFSDIFKFVRTMQLYGYIIFGNADIFYDTSLDKLYTSQLARRPTMFCQTRLDWNDVEECAQLPRLHSEDLRNGSSQDSWLYHSRWTPALCPPLDFAFGQGGCDNHFCFVAAQLGFELYNEPFTVRTNHYHITSARTWPSEELIVANILCVPPYIPPRHARA